MRVNWRFNFFSWFNFVCGTLNFTVDLLQSDKFKADRDTIRRYKEGERLMSSMDNDELQLSRCDKENGLLNKLRWLAHYNQMGFLVIQNLIVHFLMLVYFSLNSFLFSFLRLSRNVETLEYNNPILRYLESNYLMLDWLDCYKRNKYYHRAVLVIVTQYLLIKIVTMKRILETSQLNKYHYKRLNIIQLDFAYSMSMSSDWSGWMWLLYHRGHHDCRIAKSLHDSKSMKMKELFYSVDKIDRLYYYNVIDFQDCYQDRNMLKKEEQVTTPAYSEVGWLVWLTSWWLPARKFYSSNPNHRADPNDLALMLILNNIGLVGMAAAYTAALVIMFTNTFKNSSINFQNLMDLFHQPRLLTVVCHILACFTLIAANVADNACLLLSSIVWYSRANKIRKMLNHEADLCRQNLLIFYNKYLLERHSDISTRTSGYDTPISKRFEETALGSDSKSHEATYEQLAHLYKASQLDRAKVREFNANLLYLMDLIGHLKREQADLKRFFTFRIETVFACGALASTIAMTEWVRAETFGEASVVCAFFVVVMLPMFIALFLGATTEAAARKICRSLEPLLANDLRLLEPRTVRKMQKVYVFLAKAQNRGFVLFGNISLTFSAIVTIFGIMASVYPLVRDRRAHV